MQAVLTSRIRRVAGLVTAAVLVSAGALTTGAWASTAPSPTWTAATTLTPNGQSDPVLNNDRIDTALGSSGDAVVGWLSGMANSDGPGTVTAAYRAGRADATWEVANVTTSATATSEPRVAVDAGGDAVMAWEQADGLYAAYRPAGIGQSWTAPQQVDAQPDLGVSIAMDAAGNTIVAWGRERTVGYTIGDTAMVAYRPAGAGNSWSSAEAITDPSGSSVDGTPVVAVDSAGDALLVYPIDDIRLGCGFYDCWGVAMAQRDHDSGTFGTNTFGPAANFQTFCCQYAPILDLAMGTDGSAALAWYYPHRDSYLAYRPGGQASFDAPVIGEYGTVSVDPAGEAFAVQGQSRYSAGQDYYHPAGAGQSWTAVGTGTFAWAGGYTAQYAPTDAAIDSNGQGIVIGDETDEVTYSFGTFAAVRGTDGTWSSIAQLSSDTDSTTSQRVATDSSGDGVAAWVEDVGGSDVVRVAGLVGGPSVTTVDIPSSVGEGTPANLSVTPHDVWNTLADSGITWSITSESDPNDTTTATGAAISHTFSSVGTYDVTVSAVDSAGSTATSSVHKVAVVPPNLTVATDSTDGVGAGRVVSTVGSISCGDGATACTEAVPYAGGSPDQVSLNAVPDTSSYLSGWNGCADDSKVTCSVTLGSDATVTASFAHCPVAGTCQPFTGPDTAVSAVCPAGGTTTGDSLVTLTGKDLVTGDHVLFDGQPATSVSASADHTSLTVRTPAHPAGQVQVAVQDLSGFTGSFTYEDGSPQLTGPSGIAVGYTNPGTVTLTGTNLFDISELYDVDTGTDITGYQPSCDGTSLSFTPPDLTTVSVGATTWTADNVTVTTPNGTTPEFQIHRTLPYTQDGGQVISGLQPDYADVLPGTASTQTFTDTFSDNNGGTIDVTVPSGDLPPGTVLNVYSGKGADLVSQMPAGVTAVGGYAVAWTAPDGSHPVVAEPIVITIHDPTVTASKTVYSEDAAGHLVPLPVTHTVSNNDNASLFVQLDDHGHVVATFPLLAGESISGAQVISAGGGNVITAGGGNVITAGGGNFTMALMSRTALINAMSAGIITAGGGNVITAGGGNIITAGGGNMISTLLNSAAVISAGGGNVITAGGGNLITAGGGNLTSSGAAAMWAIGGAGSLTIGFPADPEIVAADPPAPPGAPSGVSATAVGTTATVSWTAPSPGGSAISGYAVQVFDGGNQVDNAIFGAGANTEVIGGLTAGHSYTFTVEAYNGGYGPASDPSKVVTATSGVTGGSSGPAPASGTPEAAGGTFSSSSALPSASSPVVVKVTTPVAGNVSVDPATGGVAPAGFEAFGQAMQITAPGGTAARPLILTFEVDRSALPAGVDDSELTVTRDGAPAARCLGATTIGSADPCVTSVVDHGSFVTITVLSTHASAWTEVAATTDRMAGADRIGTAVATSQAYFGTGQATAAVVARDDSYADALAGDPLAAAKGGPLLLSDPSGLPGAVGAELTRALAPRATVYLLGGTSALSPAVEQAVAALGFTVVRVAGADRYSTAVAVAGAIGTPSAVLLANGLDFPDALAAGAAAPEAGAVVLLTAGGAQTPATAAYLNRHAAMAVYAVGGPAASADPQATPVVGADRYATAVAVARQFFPRARAAGLASGLGFADALSAGAVLGANGEPLLLTDPRTMSSTTASYIQGRITELHTFGGPAAVAFNPTPALSAPAVLFRFLEAAVM